METLVPTNIKGNLTTNHLQMIGEEINTMTTILPGDPQCQLLLHPVMLQSGANGVLAVKNVAVEKG